MEFPKHVYVQCYLAGNEWLWKDDLDSKAPAGGWRSHAAEWIVKDAGKWSLSLKASHRSYSPGRKSLDIHTCMQVLPATLHIVCQGFLFTFGRKKTWFVGNPWKKKRENVLRKFALQNGALKIYLNKFKDVFHYNQIYRGEVINHVLMILSSWCYPTPTPVLIDNELKC